MSFYHRKKSHDSFENRVYTELEHNGFVVLDLTYHTHLDDRTISRLKYIRTPTALLIRTRADRIILHQTEPIVSKIEVKTSGYHNGSFAIEAFPLATHAIESTIMNVPCLYICYHTQTQHEYGFWIQEIIPYIKRIFIPPIWHTFTKQNEQWLLNAFPHAELCYQEYSTRGSNTPYIRISEPITKTLPHWKTLVQQLLEQYNAPHTSTPNNNQNPNTVFGINSWNVHEIADNPQG